MDYLKPRKTTHHDKWIIAAFSFCVFLSGCSLNGELNELNRLSALERYRLCEKSAENLQPAINVTVPKNQCNPVDPGCNFTYRLRRNNFDEKRFETGVAFDRLKSNQVAACESALSQECESQTSGESCAILAKLIFEKQTMLDSIGFFDSDQELAVSKKAAAKTIRLERFRMLYTESLDWSRQACKIDKNYCAQFQQLKNRAKSAIISNANELVWQQFESEFDRNSPLEGDGN